MNKPYGWLRSLISILAFIVGSYLFSLTRYFGSHRRGTLSASFFIQGICLVIAAALVQGGVVPDTVDKADAMTVLIPIIFLGFQAGGQVGASDVLGFKEIPTTVLTSVYYGIASDSHIADGFSKNVKRNRRVAAIVLLLLGAIAGGWLTKSAGGLPSILWIAAGLKFIIAGAWLVWRKAE